MKTNDFLRALSEDRSKDAEVLKKPQYAGIMNMVTELYPDNAHFIYELLQNAEDTEATTITFSLTSEKLVAEHNGTRLFTENDVESITSIGNSTKRDDTTSIGKFGVGFKAVFSYTNTPIVYSGNFAFKIRDLVVPEIIAPLDKRTDTTIFEFPFNNLKKPALLATREVEKGFVGFGDNTLLFLSHIRKINYSLPDGSQGSLERIDHENGRIEIRAKHPHSEETISHWLHFHKDVEIIDADGNNKNCRVAIAYQLEKIIDKNKDSESWKIVPIRGQVSIYFPAEKETSELKFHIHAPFASTVARDSVRDCADNEQLRNHIAALIVESLSIIRDEGLLTINFLAVLPTQKDGLAPFYEPIRETIVDGFKTQLLTPTKSGSHAAAGALYRGSAKISDVIEDEDLSILTGYEIPLWSANAPQRNQREDNFLDSLSIDKWDFEELSEIFAPANKEKTASWLEIKDDNWLRRFYVLLKDAKQHHEENHYQTWFGKNFPLVRVNSEYGVKHVLGNEAYFESFHSHISTNAGYFVKREVYTKDSAKQDVDKNAEEFLQSIGVRPFNQKAAIELRLKFYQSINPEQITDEYYDDIKQFVSYWKENATEVSHYKRQTEELFKPMNFLLGVSNGNLHWNNATEICLDSPIIETGLGELFEIHGKSLLHNRYSEKLNKDELKNFAEFAAAIGVMHKLEIVKLDSKSANKNPNNPYKDSNFNGEGFDYSIPDLKKYLIAKKVTISQLVWNVLIKSDPLRNVKIASFKPNRKPEKHFDSLLIFYLKNNSWIPTKLGEFCTPQAMTRDDLHDDFIFNDENGLLSAIDFGKNAKDKEEQEKRIQEQATSSFKEKEKIAKDMGFESVDEMKAAAQLILDAKAEGKSLDDMRTATLTQQTIPNFSDDFSEDPTRRAEKVKEAADDAPDKRTERRERSVQTGDVEKVKQSAKEYLRDRYTVEDVLYCQICKEAMPFKQLFDGRYYFEAIPLVNNTKKLHRENYIALCPNDAAKFQYANSSKDNPKDMLDLLINDRSEEEINDSYDNEETSFEIELAGETKTLTFTPKHLADLKTILFS